MSDDDDDNDNNDNAVQKFRQILSSPSYTVQSAYKKRGEATEFRIVLLLLTNVMWFMGFFSVVA